MVDATYKNEIGNYKEIQWPMDIRQRENNDLQNTKQKTKN